MLLLDVASLSLGIEVRQMVPVNRKITCVSASLRQVALKCWVGRCPRCGIGRVGFELLLIATHASFHFSMASHGLQRFAMRA